MIEAERCRRSLAEFIRQAWHAIEPSTEYLHNWHIDIISEYLQAVTAGEITRLLINIPPRYMKSSAVSVMWPLWEWTFRPHTRWMFATYAQSLSDDHSLKRMTILKSDWYRSHWGDSVVLTKENVATVMNDRLGVFESTSFAGTATGKGANRLVIDDPHNPKMAESDLERASTLRDFNTTFSTRLNDKKRDAIVVVMQRLHEDDVSARCVELGYVHLCLPAESEGRTVVRFPTSGRELVREDGDLLWPEREGPEEIASVKVALGPYGFAGQYQQRPAPRTGGMFPAAWTIVGAIPAGSRFVRAWDKAGTQGGGAYSAGVKMARSPDGRYFVVDVVRGQWSASQREAAIKQTAVLDTPGVPIVVEQEPGSGGKESAENTIINLAGYAAEAKPASGEGSKTARATPLAAQAQVGNVSLVEGAWNRAFVEEACLAKGTLVVTIRGHVPIEDVTTEDHVATRQGWRRVLHSACTHEAAIVCEVQTDDGRKLLATPNHPILVPDSGFKQAGRLRVGDGLLRFIAGSSSASTPNQGSSITPARSPDVTSSCTATFGSAKSALSRPAIMSTIGMRTPRTTPSATWSASPPLNTSDGTRSISPNDPRSPRPASSAGPDTSPLDPEDQRSAPEPAGTSFRRIEGTRSSMVALALCATRPFVRLIPGRFIAPGRVPRRSSSDTAGSPRSLANPAVDHSSRRLPKPVFAADVAVSSVVTLPGRRPVYNLEVEGCPEFVANGILVHNCMFPNSRYKDQVDAASMAFNKLALAPAPPKLVTFENPLRGYRG